MPNPGKLVIIDQQNSEDGSLQLMNVREVKAAKTLSLPLLYLHGRGEDDFKFNLRPPTSGDTARDVVGLINDVEQAAEGEMWAATSTGLRSPTAYRDSPEGRAHQWVKTCPYETRQEYILHQQGQMIGLWQDEEDMGRLLVKARETDGLGKAEPIFREKTPIELQWEQESRSKRR